MSTATCSVTNASLLSVQDSAPACPQYKPAITALEMLQRGNSVGGLTFGDGYLDACVTNGVPLQGITEISGQSGVGKTQICLHLMLRCVLPKELGGLGGRPVYLSTEGKFPTERLEQMAASFCMKHKLNLNEVMESIYVQTVTSVEELWGVLSTKLPSFLTVHPVRLLIIDSIAALFRHDYEPYQIPARAAELFRHSSLLKRLSEQYLMPIVLVNQVTDLFDDDVGPISSWQPQEGKVVPALGLAWSNCVNHRILLSRTSHLAENGASQSIQRTMRVVLSPHIPCTSCDFVVNADGIHGVEINV